VDRLYIVRKRGGEQITHVDARDNILAMGAIDSFFFDGHVER
jgi:hypothetical protein